MFYGAHADLVALVVAHGHVVSTSFEGAGVLACNGLPPPSCRGGSQEHVRVAWMSGGVLRWQGACARCVGFRQPRVGGRPAAATVSRLRAPTAVARVGLGVERTAESSIIDVRAIGSRVLRWARQPFIGPVGQGSDGLSVTPQLHT